jgi:hypothetical protein
LPAGRQQKLHSRLRVWQFADQHAVVFAEQPPDADDMTSSCLNLLASGLSSFDRVLDGSDALVDKLRKNNVSCHFRLLGSGGECLAKAVRLSPPLITPVTPVLRMPTKCCKPTQQFYNPIWHRGKVKQMCRITGKRLSGRGVGPSLTVTFMLPTDAHPDQ